LSLTNHVLPGERGKKGGGKNAGSAVQPTDPTRAPVVVNVIYRKEKKRVRGKGEAPMRKGKGRKKKSRDMSGKGAEHFG